MRVVDGITFDGCKVELKAWLGITGTSEDTLLEMWFNTAVEAADRYLMRDFIPNKYRWTFTGSPEAGDEVSVSVYSALADTVQEVTHVVVAGETLIAIARELQAALYKKVYSYEYKATAHGAAVVLWGINRAATVEASCAVTLAAAGDLAVSEAIEWAALPGQVVAAVYAYIKASRDLRFRGHGVQSVTTSALSESYWYAAGRSGISASDPASAMITLLRPYKMPLYAGRLP